MIVSQELEHCLPYMRRFARALTGSQSAGDAMVEACLEVLISAEGHDRSVATNPFSNIQNS